MKKLLLGSVAVAALLFASCVQGPEEETFIPFSDELTAEDIPTAEEGGAKYSVSTAADLVKLSQLVADGATFDGCVIKQIEDIDMNPGATLLDENFNFVADPTTLTNFVPIGNADKPFMGSYNGDNHVIKGLYINLLESHKGVGFIGGITTEAEDPVYVKNLSIVDSYITVDESLKDDDRTRIGTIVGLGINTKIENCYVNAFVNGPWLGPKGVSEMTGESVVVPAERQNCTGAETYGSEYVGGVAGRVEGGSSISKCIFNGKVYCGYGSCGGILGRNKDSTVDCCLVMGEHIDCLYGTYAVASGATNSFAVEGVYDEKLENATKITAAEVETYAKKNENGTYTMIYEAPAEEE